MNFLLWHFQRIRSFNSSSLKFISLIDRRSSHQLRSRRFPFKAACIHEKPKTLQTIYYTPKKLVPLRPYFWNQGIVCRSFHLSNPSPSVNPLVIWAVSNVLTIAVAVLGHQVFLVRMGRIPRSDTTEFKLMKFAATTFLVLSFGMLMYYLTHLETAPITHRNRFIAFSNDEMINMTSYETRMINMEFGRHYLDKRSPTFIRVQRVVSRILSANQNVKEIRDRQWNLVVIDLPDIKNAFILPNGNMYVFTGILNLCDNDDEVGFVVSHELSHAVLEHLAEQMSHMYIGEFLFLVPIFFIWSYLPTLTAIIAHVIARSCADVLFNLPFSRFSEIEADVIGIQLASKACFDPRLSMIFWRKMMLTNDEEVPLRYKIEWLSTHPSYETRSHYLERVIPEALKVRRDSKCPPLSSTPVRNDADLTDDYENT